MAYSPNSTQNWQGLSYDQIFYDEWNQLGYQHQAAMNPPGYQPQYVWPNHANSPTGLVTPNTSAGGCYLCSFAKKTDQKLVAKRCEILGYMDSIITQAEAKSWKPREYRVSNPYYECVAGLTTHYRTFPIIYDASVPFEVIRLIWDAA